MNIGEAQDKKMLLESERVPVTKFQWEITPNKVVKA